MNFGRQNYFKVLFILITNYLLYKCSLMAILLTLFQSVSNIELTLVSLYNTEVLSEKGIAEVASFRLPTLARQSVYHEVCSFIFQVACFAFLSF